MSIKRVLLSLILLLSLATPVRAANDYISASKSISPSNLDNVCDSTNVEIKVEGLDKEAELRKKLDIVLIMDHSYSMFEYNDGRMGESQTAATTFIDQLDPNFDHVGLVRFSTTAQNQENLTNAYSPVKNTINGYHLDGFSAFTNLEDAIDKGIDEIDNNGRSDATKLMILFSDGGVNRPLNGGSEDKPYAKGKALDKANEAGSKDIIIYTVTLGTSNIDADLMDDIADATGGKSFVAPNPQDIVDAYLKIASDLTDSVASNIKVTDVINNKFIFVGGSDSPAANITANPDGSKTLKWNIGLLKSNQEVKFKYKVMPTVKGNNQAIDSNPLSKVDYSDVNGDPQTITLPTTTVSVKSDDCGRGGGNGDDNDDDNDNDDDDDNHNSNKNDDNDDDGQGSVLGAATSRLSQLPVTGGISNILYNKCGDNMELQLLLLAQAILHGVVVVLKKGKYQVLVALVFPALIYFSSLCVGPLLVASIVIGAGFIVLSRILSTGYIFKRD